MILILFSYLLALIVCLYFYVQGVGALFSSLPLERNEARTFSLLWSEGLRSLLSGDYRQNTKAALLKLALKLRGRRAAILQLSLGALAFAPLIVWSGALMNMNGIYLLALAAILFFIGETFAGVWLRTNFLFGMLKRIGKVLFFFAVALFLFEQAQRLASQVLMVAHEYEWTFFLSQSEPMNQAVLFLLGGLLSLFLPLAGWSFVASLLLLSSGLLAFNNALFLMAGEFFFFPIVVLYFSKVRLSFEVKQLRRSFVLVLLVGVLAGLFLSLFIKENFFAREALAFGQVKSRVGALSFCLILMLAVQFFVTMFWGHFASKKQMEDLSVGNYQWAADWVRGFTAEHEQIWTRSQIEVRVQVLTTQKAEIEQQQLKGIPPVILQKHAAEMSELKQLLRLLQGR